MSRDEGGHWLPIHPGLLDDERWMKIGRAREAWIILFLAADREAAPGWFKDRPRVAFLLRKHGITKPDGQIDALVRTGWLMPENLDSPRLTLRGWHRYTSETYRHRVRNAARGDRSEEYARRPTTRAGRVRSVTERDGALDETRLDEKPRARPHEAGRGGVTKEEANRIFQDLAAKGVIRGAPRILGQPGEVVE